MEFFESKEEILDIQLTEYGKQKIAEGRFKPVFYAFFDDDIIYDTAYGGYSEQQNHDQNRILNTSRLKLQTNKAGINTTSNEEKQDQSIADKFHFLKSPLGTADSANTNAPAWSVRFFNENLVRAVQRPTGSYYTFDTVPRLYATAEYKTFVNEIDAQTKNLVDAFTFPDGTFIDLEEDSLFIRISEHNVPFEKENFEIEIFELEEKVVNGVLKETLYPLEFKQQNDIETEKNVEYFLEVNIDVEIDSKEFCAKVPRDERTLYFIDRIHDCQKETQEKVKQDIYDESESGDIC